MFKLNTLYLASILFTRVKFACVYTHVKSTRQWESILKETDVGMITLNDWCHVRRSDASPGEFLPQMKKPKKSITIGVTSCVKTFEATSTTRQVPCYWVIASVACFRKGGEESGAPFALAHLKLSLPPFSFLCLH